MSKRRVVITGLGAVTPVGGNVSESWKALCAGVSGVRRIDIFDASRYPCQISAPVKQFDASAVFSSKDIRKTEYFVQYGVVAAEEAVLDSGLEINEQNAHRVGVSIGSGIGGLSNIESTSVVLDKSGPKKISPFFIPASIINMISGHVSIRHGAKGPNLATVTACTTGSHNIGLSARLIAYGDADVMLAGGSEMATCGLGVGGFSAMRALSTRNDAPELASRPWDRDRDGFVLGDGAGVLVLEEYEHARRRGAKIYAELVGVGMSGDAYHMTMPDSDGAVRAINAALNDAGLNKEDIDYINAHATSTPLGDAGETKAIKMAFGEYSKRLPISSTKSMTGHALGAAGAMEAVFSILAVYDQVAPPTINLENPSDDCDLDYVPKTARQMKLCTSLSNSFGFGGTNGCLIFKRI